MVRVVDAGADTSRGVVGLVEDRWRTMSAIDKLDVVTDLNRACDQLSASGVRRRYPEASDAEVQRRVVALRLGRELMVRVYGWDPVVEGW